ncbi:MAG: hypothetical protein CXT67_05265 [Methanobacteriota archaeon]|jgi:molybdopterin converting factor small subunit|nr:MAG: hypothetical protein CXT67_05265 [Euryarchaeota archaeon]HIG20059.1 MoaD/ThiS family protein [Candidatus Poseidoniales archaeon]
MREEEATNAVKFTVLLFGPLAEKFGTKTLEFPLNIGTTIQDLAERMQIAEMLGNGMKVALNGEFCSPDVEIPDAGEIAFLPPVSGG